MKIDLSSLRTKYNAAMDMLVSSTGFGTPCSFVYEDTGSQCPNCDFDPISRRSNGQYNGSGPQPFGYGQMCPVCAGDGKINSQKTETVYLATIFSQKDFMSVGSVTAPVGDMQSISNIDTYTQIKSADYIVPSGSITDYRQNPYTRMSEPEFVSLGDNRFIITNWQRGGEV